MKRFDHLNEHEKQCGISVAFQEIVENVVNGFMDIDFNDPENNEFVKYARQTAQDTGDYARMYTVVGQRFHNDLIKIAESVAQDSYYDDNGNIIMESFSNENH